MTEDDGRLTAILTAYEAALAGWLDAVDDLAEDRWSTPTGCPGWSVQDQLSHVVSVERQLLGDRAEEVELPEHDHVRGDFGRAVEQGVELRRRRAPSEVLEEARETFARRLVALRSIDPAWLDETVEPPLPLGSMRGAQLLRTRVFDITSHEYDVRRAIGRTDRKAGPHVAVAAELIVRGWGRVLPNRIDVQTVIGVELDGAELARIALGDGQLLRGEGGPPADLVLAFDAASLLAIAGQRSDAPSPESLTVRGDEELARRVVTSAGITP